MDKTAEYEAIKDSITQELSYGVEHAPNIKEWVLSLREQLISELETENDGAIHGRNNIPDEVLRKYVSITKEIRAFWFDNIDTHLLTIERLADQTCARRRAYERARGKVNTQSITPANIINDGKAVVQKAPIDKTASVLGDLAKLKPEEIAKILAALAPK